MFPSFFFFFLLTYVWLPAPGIEIGNSCYKTIYCAALNPLIRFTIFYLYTQLCFQNALLEKKNTCFWLKKYWSVKRWNFTEIIRTIMVMLSMVWKQSCNHLPAIIIRQPGRGCVSACLLKTKYSSYKIETIRYNYVFTQLRLNGLWTLNRATFFNNNIRLINHINVGI